MATPSIRRVDPDALLLGNSPAMVRVRDELALLAPLDCPVRLEGPSGTGKGVAARLLHAESPRARGPFVSCSLATIGGGTALGELRGYCRGAFTGAHTDRAGVLEAAQGGTCFLDEIGVASPPVQKALMDFVEEGAVRRIGEGRRREIDARVVFATNVDLSALVAAGKFRADLLYRMKQFVVRMPALAERPADIPLLVEYFLVAKAALYARPTPRMSPAEMDRLVAYGWPGNVRELAGALEYRVVLGRLPEALAGQNVPSTWHDDIPDALARCGGNKTAAARVLGVSRTTLYQALHRDRTSS